MTITLCPGRSATGKTEACIQKIRSTLEAAPLSEIWVLVPDRLQASYFRQRLAGAGGSIGAQVGNFRELASHLLEIQGRNLPVAPAPLIQHIIRDVIDQAAASGELIQFKAICGLPGFSQVLRDTFSELKRSHVSPERFLAYSSGRSPAQTELAILYRAYQSRLTLLGWEDSDGLQWKALETLENEKDVADSIRLIVVDGFDTFTSLQLAILKALSSQVELFLTLPGEPGSTRPALRRFLDDFEKIRRELSPAISSNQTQPMLPEESRFLENQFYEPFAGERRKIDPQPPFLFEVYSPAGEARKALRWIKARIIRDGLSLSDCAIFTPNPDVYNPFIRLAALEFGIPLHFTQGLSLVESTSITALINLLNLPAQNFATRLLFNSLRSPYFNFGLDCANVDSLEEISRREIITEGLDQWQAAWESLIPLQAVDQAEQLEEDLDPNLPSVEKALDLRGKLQGVFDLLSLPGGTQALTGWVSWLEDLLEHLGFFEKAENDPLETACDVLRETLRAMVMSEVVTGAQPVDYKNFLANLSGILGSAALPEPQTPKLPALLVGRMIDARGVRFKAVALLGLSEGIFPQVERPDPFLDEALRKTLGLEERLNREQAGLFYQAITRSDKFLLLTRPYLSEDGEAWEASPFWKDIEKRYDPAAVRRIGQDLTLALSNAASSQELLFEAMKRGGLPAEYSELNSRWENLERAGAVLRSRSAKKPEGEFEGVLPGITAQMREKFNPQMIWSTSKLEAYGTCPFQFYVKETLKLEPRRLPELGMDISQKGSLLHKILEETFASAANPSDLSELLERLQQVSRTVFSTAAADYGFRPSYLWSLDQAEMLNTLETTISALVEKSQGYQPVYFEQKFGMGDTPPLKISLDGELILLRGIIDRVDRNSQGKCRVIDYKTGGTFKLSDLKSGKRLQLPIYAMAVQIALELGQVEEGWYWNIQAAETGQLKLSSFASPENSGVENAIQIVKSHLGKIVEGIRAAKFPPKPPKSGCPNYCPAAPWCWRFEAGWGAEK